MMIFIVEMHRCNMDVQNGRVMDIHDEYHVLVLFLYDEDKFIWWEYIVDTNIDLYDTKTQLIFVNI